MTALVRPAEPADLEPINEIYNHYVRSTPITFDLDPITMDAREEWFTHFSRTGRHRLFVAEEDGRVLGYAYSGEFRARRAYDTTVESTIYLAPDACGRGLGIALYETLFAAIADEDIHRVIAGVTLPNAASVAIHERFGFTRVAVFTEVGWKFNRYWDVAFFEKPFGTLDP